MTARIFVNSNILVYAYDGHEPVKHERAVGCLHELWQEKRGVLSIQVLQEFYVNATRKLKDPLTPAEGRQVLAKYATWQPIRPDAGALMRASQLAERHQLHYWDALIVVTALEAGASVLYSEDFADGAIIEGVRVVNPLLISLK